ncbi:hypothetical protein KKB44_04505 [Candidatus Micrarchaeota archaeon]|nr:hypothetical protein [Candidatus Micrarchaeota archaeon]
MSKLALILLWLVLFSISHATFPRPWENKSWVATNPHIWNYGAEIWWGLPQLHQTLESLDISDIEDFTIEEPTKKHLDNAIAAGTQADNNMARCIDLDILPWTAVAIGGPITGPFILLIAEFSKASACMGYKSSWITTVDSSLSAIEKSTTEAERSIQSARQSYTDITFMGLCDSTYTYPGSEHCAEIENAFSAVDNNITEGRYGQSSLLNLYSSELDQELHKPSPDLSLVRTAIALVWGDNGIIFSFNNLKQKADASKQLAQQQYTLLEDSAKGRKDIVQKSLQELQKEKLHLITEAPSDASFRRVGTVSEIFSETFQREQDLAIEFEETQLESKRVLKKSYMKNAVTSMADIDDGYAELIEDLALLTDYASAAVLQQKQEAEKELGETEIYFQSTLPSEASVDLYHQAKFYFEDASTTTILGTQFVSYSKSAALSRAARSETYEQESSSSASLTELEDLIKRAELDDVNVFSEKESVKLLKKLESFETLPYILALVDNIIVKSRNKYESAILSTRSEILHKIELAGGSASDLYTDLEHYEFGIIDDDSIKYPDAIGQLKNLNTHYHDLELELDQHLTDIIANSLIVSATPLITNVQADEPADILLDILITNSQEYSTDNAKLNLNLPSIPFFYSDISYGTENVQDLRSSGRYLTIVLNHISPFETKHIILEKQSVLMHTIEKKISAQGLGDGSAQITETLEFELDIDVPSITAPQNSLIDGDDPGRFLTAGKHTLYSEKTIEDAYTEEIDDITVYSIGINSQVEYDITLIPSIDLESIILFVDTLNDSRVSSINIVAATGESVRNKKQISPTQSSAYIYDLKTGIPTIIRVSYNVENTQSFATDQIKQFELMNLSPLAEETLEQAKIQAESGDYSEALEFIEKVKAISKEDEKQNAKLRKKAQDLYSEIQNELDELNHALSKTNLTSSFTDKLSSRKSELEKILLASNNSSFSEQITLFEKVDQNWLKKELTSFKKSAYNEYNDLKERFYVAGNTSMASEFLEFEDLFTKLETGNRAEYAVDVITALDAVNQIVTAQEAHAVLEKESLSITFESLKSDTENVLAHYTKEMTASKGTEYSSLFTLSEKNVVNIIKEVEDALNTEPRLFALKLKTLDENKNKMQQILDSLKNESEAKLSLLISLSEQVNEEDWADFSEKLGLMSRLIAAGEYVNALRTGSALTKEIDSYEPATDNNLIILVVTVLAILATIAVYIIKQQKEKPKKRKLMSFEDSN